MLIKKIQAGDTEAFEVLVRKYYSAVYRFCCHRLNGDVDTAADITQDVFLKLLDSGFKPGQRAAALMGGMGRSFNGGDGMRAAPAGCSKYVDWLEEVKN